MTAELVRGQNHPLPGARLEIRISAGKPIVAGAVLSDAQGRTPGPAWVAHPGTPALPGLEVSQQVAADHRLAVDLAALPEDAHRLSVLLALPTGTGGPARFGALPAPYVAVTAPDGSEIANYTVTGLDSESAVVVLELYRRQDAWKVRAVGQGYAGGLAALFADLLADRDAAEARRLADEVADAVTRGLSRSVAPPRVTSDGSAAQGGRPATQPGRPTPSQEPADTTGDTGTGSPRPLPDAGGGPVDYTHPARRRTAPPPPPPSAPPAPPGRPAAPVAGDATGWSMEERLYNQVWGMFEDLARTAAAYRSAVDFADQRRERELDAALADPRARLGGQGEAAREAARARYADLVEQARAVLDRDLAQLRAESEVVEPALPPAFARWDSPVWQDFRVPMEMPMALRLGDLHLPECGDVRIPMLVRLPLERGMWIDSGRAPGGVGMLVDPEEVRRLALDTAVTHAARLLAAYPAGEFAVHVIDPAGSGAEAFAPLVEAGVLAAPPGAGPAAVAQVLGVLTQRVDLLQMAFRGGAPDALPPDLDTAEQLLVVNDFPHGFDDRAVTQLRYLADEGPAVGVHLMLVADREDAAGYGPLLDPLWRALLRLTPVPDDHLADPWVGHAWTYEPPGAPLGSRVLAQVLERVATARREWNR
ncbi:TerD family protein [Streptomyces griseoaurantiacus]|uniref:TerD family protein n=1 Tax=Streptomyces griseoaurantiacus TaxID=68213 RepID=UPI0034602033